MWNLLDPRVRDGTTSSHHCMMDRETPTVNDVVFVDILQMNEAGGYKVREQGVLFRSFPFFQLLDAVPEILKCLEEHGFARGELAAVASPSQASQAFYSSSSPSSPSSPSSSQH